MKHFYLTALALLFCALANAQAIGNPQLLNARYSKIEFFDQNTGIAFGMGTMIRTEDAGLHWSFVALNMASNEGEKLNSIAVLDENSAIIVGYGNTMLKTTDKGLTWNALPTGIDATINFASINFPDGLHGYVTGFSYDTENTDGQRYTLTTANGGATWTAVNANFNDYINFYDAVYTHFIDVQHGLAWQGNRLFTTTDGGLNWILTDNPSGTDTYTDKTIASIKTAADGTLVMGVISAIGYFYISENQGATWTPVTALSGNNVYVISTNDTVFDVHGSKIYVVSQADGITGKAFVSYDIATGELTSHPINTDMIYQCCVHMIDANNGYIADIGTAFYSSTPGRKMLRTSDGGVTWNEFDSLVIYVLNGSQNVTLKKNGPGTYTLARQNGISNPSNFNLFTSTDDGATWQLKVNDANLSGSLLLAQGNYISYLRNTGTDAAQGFSLFESDDLGISWRSTPIDSDYITGIDAKQTYGNMLVQGNSITFSDDRGHTWQHIDFPVVSTVTFEKSFVKSTNEIYAWGYGAGPLYGYYLYRTTNVGTTWQQVVHIEGNIARYTKIGQDTGILLAGNNLYYKIDLTNSTYEQLVITSPAEDAYIDDTTLTLLNDNVWQYKGYDNSLNSVTYFTTNSGQEWLTSPCLVCGTLQYDAQTAEIITYTDDRGTERMDTQLPIMPFLNGDTEAVTGTQTDYIITNSNENIVPEWQLDGGGTIEQVSNTAITVHWTAAGTHTIRVRGTNSYGQSAFYEKRVTVSAPLSTDQESVSKLSVYPNPFTDSVTLKLNGDSDISVFTVSGQQLFSAHTADINYTISSLKNLSAGIYFLVVKSSGAVYNQKIIKQ